MSLISLGLKIPGQVISKVFTVWAPSRREAVIRWILNKMEAVSFSSHTAAPLQAEIENIEVFPISFVRYTIDRIASAYTFERKQNLNNFGCILARNTSLGGYIDLHLS